MSRLDLGAKIFATGFSRMFMVRAIILPGTCPKNFPPLSSAKHDKFVNEISLSLGLRFARKLRIAPCLGYLQTVKVERVVLYFPLLLNHAVSEMSRKYRQIRLDVSFRGRISLETP